MSSPHCHYGCHPPYNNILDGGRPCDACMAQHEADMQRSWQEYQLERQAKIASAILPATDREWFDHCDQVAPVVTMPPLGDQVCPLCAGQRTVRWFLHSQPCPWCGGIGVVPDRADFDVPCLASPGTRSKPFIDSCGPYDTL